MRYVFPLSDPRRSGVQPLSPKVVSFIVMFLFDVSAAAMRAVFGVEG
jgi:hypothetical protein